MNRLIALFLSLIFATPAFALNYSSSSGGGGGGSGTVNSGTAGKFAWYASTGAAVDSNSNASISNGAVSFGTASTTAGSLKLFGGTSGFTTIGVPATAATAGVFTLPPDNGTAGYVLRTDGAGVTTWVPAGVAALTNTHIFVGNGSNVATDVAASGDVTLANTGAFTIKSSVALAGSPTTTTQSPADNSTKIATTAYCDAAVAAGGGGSSGGITPTTTDLRVPWAFRSKGGSSAFTSYGTGSATTQGTASSGDDSNGAWINFLSPASDFGGIYYSSAGVRFDALPRIWTRVEVVDTTALRFVFGIGEYINNFYASDTANNIAAFRYNPAIDTGGTIRFYTTNSSGTATTVDTGVAYSGTHTFCVDCSNPASYKGYIDGVLVATSTTNLPSATVATYWIDLATATTATQKNIKIGSIWGDSR